MTVPSCGFSLAVSGITRPEAVVVSASFAWTTMRSSSGLIATFVAVVTVIPSWGTWSLRSSTAACKHAFRPGGPVVAGAGPLGTTPRRVAGRWHPPGESANRDVSPRLALRQGECQLRAAQITKFRRPHELHASQSTTSGTPTGRHPHHRLTTAGTSGRTWLT